MNAAIKKLMLEVSVEGETLNAFNTPAEMPILLMHASCLFAVQSMHVSCRQGLRERGNSNKMCHSSAVCVNLIILSYIQDLQMDHVCLHSENALVYMTVSKSQAIGLSRTLLCAKRWPDLDKGIPPVSENVVTRIAN